MTDYDLVFLLTAMALCAVIGAYAAGWNRGYDTANKEHRWARWIIRREQQRNIRL